jgi:hypothetical protein
MEHPSSYRRPHESPLPFPEPPRPLVPQGVDESRILKKILIRLDRIEERLTNIEKTLLAKSS